MVGMGEEKGERGEEQLSSTQRGSTNQRALVQAILWNIPSSVLVFLCELIH